MAQQRFVPRLPETLRARGGDAFTLAIARDAYAPWLLTVSAAMHDEGARFVGTIVTCPARVTGGRTSRVIASGCLPGVESWEVTGRCLLPTDGQRNDIELDLVVGVGAQLPDFRDLEYRRMRIADGVAGVRGFAPYERLVSFTARSAAGGTVQVNSEPAITVPPSVPVWVSELRAFGATLTFIGTDNYLVEYEG